MLSRNCSYVHSSDCRYSRENTKFHLSSLRVSLAICQVKFKAETRADVHWSTMAAGRPPKDPQPVLEITPEHSPLPSTITFYHERAPEVGDQHILWYNDKRNQNGELDDSAWQTIRPAATAWTTAIKQEPAATTGVAGFLNLEGEPERMAYWTMGANGAEGERHTVNVASVSSNTVSSSTVTTGSTTSTGSTGTSTGRAENRTTDTSESASPLSTSSAAVTATTIPSELRNNGLKGGAVAGVAIGCLIAGALIAGVLAWFCLRRRKPAVAGRDSEASTVALMHKEKGPAAKTRSLSSGSPIAPALEHGLPQPLEDKAITGEISKISNLIKNHVQSYYHSRAVSPGMIDYDDLQALGEKLPVSVGTLSTLLNNSATREIALRFCLAWVVTSRIQLNDSSNTTFLPPEVAKSIQSMHHVEQQSRGMRHYSFHI